MSLMSLPPYFHVLPSIQVQSNWITSDENWSDFLHVVWGQLTMICKNNEISGRIIPQLSLSQEPLELANANVTKRASLFMIKPLREVCAAHFPIAIHEFPSDPQQPTSHIEIGFFSLFQTAQHVVEIWDRIWLLVFIICLIYICTFWIMAIAIFRNIHNNNKCFVPGGALFENCMRCTPKSHWKTLIELQEGIQFAFRAFYGRTIKPRNRVRVRLCDCVRVPVLLTRNKHKNNPRTTIYVLSHHSKGPQCTAEGTDFWIQHFKLNKFIIQCDIFVRTSKKTLHYI